MPFRLDSAAVALPPRAGARMRVVFAVLGALLAIHVVHALIPFGGSLGATLIDDGVYDVMLVGSAAACLGRAALVSSERRAWGMLGVGLLLWASGDVSWSFLYANASNPPYPAVSDIGWIAFYPAAYVALGLLVRSRVPRLQRSLWLDGVIGALAVASLVSAVILPTVIESAGTLSPAGLATNLAYPALDLILVALVIVALSLNAWRPDRVWALLGLGLVCSAIGDIGYVFQVAGGTYQEGGLIDSFWPAATILIALAAWQPVRPSEPLVRAGGRRLLILPTVFGLVAIGIVTYDHFAKVVNGSLLLASAALVMVIARLRMTLGENMTMLSRSRHEALTDALTGLGNRRHLMDDLEAVIDHRESRIIAIFDLDGFKTYNDTFGHPAGDALLGRLGRNLREALGHEGTAYRMGGDEFCALIDAPSPRGQYLIEMAVDSLGETGRGFSVGCSYGAALVPEEARTAAQALQLADRRLYRQKSSRSGSTRSQTRDVLMKVLEERQPALERHMRDVAELAVAVGEQIGLAAEELDELGRAAELHDIGKMAIPDAILDKPEPLSDEEMAFIRRHTVIGEEILSAAPALVTVATLVRSSHERYDGQGYPDGLRGEAIPLGSRIVFACDAFDAITSNRPYAGRRSESEALAELERCAGTQFDPAVVDAIGEVLRRDGAVATVDDLTLTVPDSLRPA